MDKAVAGMERRQEMKRLLSVLYWLAIVLLILWAFIVFAGACV